MLRIYFFNTDSRIKRTFDYITYTAGENIEFICGNTKDSVFVGHTNQLVILLLEDSGSNYEIKSTDHRQINDLKGLAYHENGMFAVSGDRVIEL